MAFDFSSVKDKKRKTTVSEPQNKKEEEKQSSSGFDFSSVKGKTISSGTNDSERLEYMNVKEARDKKYALEQELNSLRGRTGGTTSIVSSALSSKGGIYDSSSRIETDRVRALQDEINALDRDINLASRMQTNKYLTDRAVNAEDFGSFSFEPEREKKVINPHQQNIERDNSAERFMTENEKAIYNYYFNKVGEAKAEEYLDSIQEDLNFRQAKAIFEGNEDNVLAQLALMAPTQGLEQSKSGFQGALRMVMGDDSYQPVGTYDYLGQMAKEDLADKGFKLPEWMGGQSIGQLAYDLVNTGANMAPSIAVGAFTGTGPLAFGASAAGNAYTQKINEGYSKDQATAYGVIIGVSEATLEKVVGAIGFGGKTIASKAVAKLLPKIDNAAARIAVKYGSSMLSEGIEEGLQEVLEPLYRNAAFGENNELEITEDAIYSALLGALSGGLMEGTPYAISEGINASYQNKIDKKYGKSVGKIVTEGLSAPKDSESFKIAQEAKEKLNAGEELSEEELDVLAKVSAEVPQERKQAVTEASEEKPIVLQSKEIPNPGRRTVGISEKQMETFASKLPNATKDTGKQVTAMYDIKDGVSKETFIRGVDEAYRYGSMNFSLEEMDRGGSFAKDIPSEKKLQAYYMGQRNAETATITKANEQQKKALSGVKGKVVFEGNAATKIKNDQQRSTIRFINSVLKNASSMEYHIFASYEEDGKRVYKNSEGKVVPAPNGFYDPKNHQIWIDVNAGDQGQGIMLYTLTHEHVHDIKVWSAEHYNELVKITSQAFEHAGKSFKEAVDAKYDQYNINHPDTTYEDAQEEVVAETMSGLLSDEKALREFSEQIQKQDKSLWNRIKAWFNDVIARITAAYKGVEPESEEAKLLMEQRELFEKAQKVFAEAVVTAGENYKNAGVEIDAATESVAPSVMFSERTWSESGYVKARNETARAIASELDVSLDKAYDYIDSINSVAKAIADDRARLDYDPNLDEHATVLKPNSEYGVTVDMSTLCAKRLLTTGTFDAIQKKLPNMVFDSEDIVKLRKMMMDRGYEVACGICYVESTRREMGRITQEFIDRYKIAQQTGKPIARVNANGQEVVLKSQGKTFMAEKGYTPNLGELNTTDIDFVKRDHPEVYNAYLAFMNARGQAKPKLLETRAEYKGEILKQFKNKNTVEKKNLEGGLRLQSFSDFELPHLIDMMQIVMDMSRVGLKSQAYTKVPKFAEAFGGTGIKINLSLIAKGSGVDENGNLVFDDVEGINHEEAFRIRDKFSNNVGTILVGKSDEHIRAAMADPRIDMIIPFHKSSWKESLYEALGLTGYTDYTKYQMEKPIDKSRGKIEQFHSDEYWDYSKTGDENAQIYLQKCREDGRTPVFPQFQNEPGYWKMLIDFKMYDNDGVGAPHEVVKPIFDDDYNAKILNEYKGGHRKLPVAQDVVDDFVKEYNSEVKFQDRDSEYMEAVKKADIGTMQKLVEEAAKEAGYTEKLYHGTNRFGFTVPKTEGLEPGMAWSPFFATDSEEVARTYSGIGGTRWISDNTYSEENINRAYDNAEKEMTDAKNDLYFAVSRLFPFSLDFQDLSYFADNLCDDLYMGETSEEDIYMSIDEYLDLWRSWTHLKEDYGEFENYEDFEDWEDSEEAAPVWHALERLELAIINYAKVRNMTGLEDVGNYGLYANPDNLFEIDAKGAYWNQIPFEQYDSNRKKINTRNLAAYARDNGYKGVKISNVFDDGGRGPEQMRPATVYIFFNPQEQVKSADPVTKDDNGNVIPLSERFKKENDDIRYSIREDAKKEIHKVISDKNIGGEIKLTETSPKILIGQKGVRDLPLMMKASHIRENILSEQEAKKLGLKVNEHVHYHELGEQLFIDVINDLDNVTEAYRGTKNAADSSRRENYFILISTRKDAKGNEINVPVYINEKGSYHNVFIDINKVATVYGNSDLRKYIKTQIERGNLVKIKNRSNSNSESPEHWSVDYTGTTSKANIAQLEEEVKPHQDRLSNADKNRVEILENKIERLEKELKEIESKAVLAGQMSQGKAMAKDLRRKTEAYEKAIAKKKEQISAVRQQKNELLAKAKAERAEAVERVRKADRERMEKAIADIKAKEKEKFDTARAMSDEQKRAIIKKYQTSIKKATEGRHRTDIRGKIKRVVNELNTLLTKQTKERHIPLELQKPVAAALDILNLDDPRYYNSRIKNLEEKIENAKSSEERHLLQEELNKIIDQRTAFKDKIAGLKKAYEAIRTSTDPYIAVGYNENIAKMIDRVAEDIGDTLLRDMSMTQLQEVYDLYKGILKTVRDANKFFNEEKGASVVEAGRNVVSEIEASGKTIDQISKKKLERKKFFWNNLKPVYAFKKLGSKTLENLFGGILKGQGTWAKDVSEAKDFFERIGNKYGYKKWDKKKTFEFTSNTGKKFSLNLQQMMSLYAYSKRDQAFKHLTDGGFVFDNKETIKKNGKEYVVNTAQAYNISAATLQQIIEKLSTDQRMFVDEMQKYLSETMGAKGNEVSRAMYDIELFREAEGYFPLKSAKQFLYDRNEVTNETRQLVNSGFTKPIQPGANNPIILTGFMDVWANHVNDMSMYHAFVMPIENFNKVYNFQFGRSEDSDSKSVKSAIQDSFTEAANQYIEQLLKDINGGARVDSREGWYKTMLARWKKAKVMGSWSVVVQQPSAIGRAYAEVDFKYFVNPKKISKPNKERAWEQLKKYAPVAIIKEMGYFDTDMGQSTVEFIKGEKTLMDKIDDVFGWMPAKADEMTWVAIWDAVKRETKAKHKDLNVNSEEFLKIAGERFTEVIDKTQVYDSVLSRSGYMRSKSSMVQTLVSFMAEPTTSANMVRQAISEFKAGNNKKGRAYIASVGVSLLFNSVLSSFIYAMRDDDEDERYYEKYIEAFAKELVDSINPLTYSPIVKDFWSILQGFGIDRPDMDLVNDLYDSIDKTIGNIKDLVEGINDGTLSEEEIKEGFKEVGEEAWSALDEILFMSGIAAGNIHRDVEAIIKTIGGAKKGIKGSDEYLEHSQRFIHDKITDAVVGQLPWNKHYIESRDNKLLDGMVSGDKVYLERLKKGYSSEDAYNNAVKAVIKNGYASKELSLEKAKQLLVKYHGEDIAEAEALLRTLDFKKAYADTSLSDSQIKNYYLPISVKNTDTLLKSPYEQGISENTYSQYVARKAECDGEDKNKDGKADSGTVKKEVMKVIDSLNLTKEQKDALYYDNGWAKGTLHEAPWR